MFASLAMQWPQSMARSVLVHKASAVVVCAPRIQHASFYQHRNVRTQEHSARTKADPSTIMMGVRASSIAVGFAVWSGGYPGKKGEAATVPAIRGTLAFKGRAHWPALDAGLKIFEAGSGRSSEELLNL